MPNRFAAKPGSPLERALDGQMTIQEAVEAGERARDAATLGRIGSDAGLSRPVHGGLRLVGQTEELAPPLAGSAPDAHS